MQYHLFVMVLAEYSSTLSLPLICNFYLAQTQQLFQTKPMMHVPLALARPTTSCVYLVQGTFK